MTQNLKASLVIGEGYNPWYNLAVEEYLSRPKPTFSIIIILSPLILFLTTPRILL